MALAALVLLGPAAACNRPRSEPVFDVDALPADAATAGDGATSPQGSPPPDASAAPGNDAADAPTAASFPDPFVPVDGTRIKGRWAVAPGNLRIWLGWYDTGMKADCEFRQAADGELRCLPRRMITSFAGYADAACTIGLLAAPRLDAEACAPSESTRFLARNDITGCGTFRQTVNRVGAPWEAPVYHNPGGTCVRKPMAGTLVQIGEVVPPGEFVKAIEVVAPLPDRTADLEPVMVVAEDGAQGLARWQERSTGAACVLSPGSLDRELCSTGDVKVASPFLYSDAQCIRPTVNRFVRECRPLARHLLNRRAGCPVAVDAFQIGAEITQGFRKQDGACVPQAAPGGDFVTYSLGPRLAEEDIPALRSVFDQNARGRLRTAWKVPPRGRRVLAGQWFDNERQQFCQPVLFRDGTQRCFSGQVDGFPPSTFADAACTRPLHQVYGAPADPAVCVPAQVAYTDLSCPRRHQVFAVGSLYQGPFFKNYGGQCEPGTPSEDIGTYNLTPVPDADFPVVTMEEPEVTR
jgi:hypothetical protein